MFVRVRLNPPIESVKDLWRIDVPTGGSRIVNRKEKITKKKLLVEKREIRSGFPWDLQGVRVCLRLSGMGGIGCSGWLGLSKLEKGLAIVRFV
jgi:hypothetical protein